MTAKAVAILNVSLQYDLQMLNEENQRLFFQTETKTKQVSGKIQSTILFTTQ